MRILAAIDSFKGSMTSEEANDIVKKTLKHHDVICFPVADGGEGTVAAFCHVEQGEFITKPMIDVNGKESTGTWGYINKTKTAIIEVAEGAGIIHARKDLFHPRYHTSYGVGEQIIQALDYGAQTIILGLGGSATVDAGMGMMIALGVTFLNHDGEVISALPVDLSQVAKIDTSGLDSRVKDVSWLVASDVTNPLTGPDGATYIFGPQKGYLSSELAEKEQAMIHFSDVVASTLNKSCRDMPGAGAAGGIGFSCYSFFNATFQSGLTLLAERGCLKALINKADLVITGEGSFDSQSLSGKVPIGISRLAKEVGTPVVLFAGKIEEGLTSLPEENILVTLPIVNEPMKLEMAMSDGQRLLKEAVERFSHVLGLGYTLYSKRS
ncbi:glycerate kinase [Halolactibacillus alkaliphilus]|uniref:Glycerate kinase n=1 Tax=Halolactibacillus alkaliphilus TaxID=442899 RepID=A0A511WZM4_9BACI|nr:glycerate kinase [Halolactibacillus alkaliphilus]GEN56139.1 glycerate kinase [Halolactibacillus alkaliphilus]GGN66949.1 glycerate kinase [Halolactibacillus alkaliphilus]